MPRTSLSRRPSDGWRTLVRRRLRWYATVGLAALAPAVLCGLAAMAIHLTQRRRYGHQSLGVAREQVEADVFSMLWMVVLVVALAVLGGLAIWVF